MTVQELIDELRRFRHDMIVVTENNCAIDGLTLHETNPVLRTIGRPRGIFADGPDYDVEVVGYIDDSLRRLATSTDQEIVVI